MILVRPRAWWYNKIPLSVLMYLLLIDGRPATWTALGALVGLVGVVCSVANYGYALNELFDRDEDRRGGRTNAAETIGSRGMWVIISLSATVAVGLASASAGVTGLLLTAGALLLPLAYSVPPLRVKERGWLGVCSDAAAAHVYPAMLAIVIFSYQSLRSPALLLVLSVALWSLAAGLRGILSHQLHSDERDRSAGLVTVVHRLGHGRLRAFVVFALLPIEVLSFAAIVMQSDATVFLKAVLGIYAVYEILKLRLHVFPVTVFTEQGESYIPFVDEGAYKVWGPLALSIDAAFSDPLYLALAPLYVIILFRPRVVHEWREVRLTAERLYASIANRVAKLRG